MSNNLETITTYQQAAQEAALTGQMDAIVSAKVNLALALFAAGDPASSIEQFDAVIALAEQENDLLTKARTIGKKGVVLLETGQLDAARQCFDTVLVLAEQLNHAELKCDSLSNTGLVLAAAGDPGRSLLKQQEATLIARETNNQQAIMNHVGLLGHAYLQLANFVDAGKSYLEALQIARTLQDVSAEMGFLNNLGIIFINMDQHDNAIKAFNEVYDLAMQRGEYHMALNAQKHLVKQSIARSDVEAIITYARTALAILNAHIDNADEQAAFEDMLLLGLMSKEAYAEAKAELVNIIAQAKQDGNQPRLLTAYGKLGDADYVLDELAAAALSYTRAVNLAVLHHDKQQETRLVGRLAAVYADLGDLEKSNQFAQRAIASGTQINDFETVGDQRVILALNAQQAGRLDEAVEHCKFAVAVLQRADTREKLSHANALLLSLQAG